MLYQILLKLVLYKVVSEIAELLVVFETSIVHVLENLATLGLEVGQVDVLEGLSIVKLFEGNHEAEVPKLEDAFVFV